MIGSASTWIFRQCYWNGSQRSRHYEQQQQHKMKEENYGKMCVDDKGCMMIIIKIVIEWLLFLRLAEHGHRFCVTWRAGRMALSIRLKVTGRTPRIQSLTDIFFTITFPFLFVIKKKKSSGFSLSSLTSPPASPFEHPYWQWSLLVKVRKVSFRVIFYTPHTPLTLPLHSSDTYKYIYIVCSIHIVKSMYFRKVLPQL